MGGNSANILVTGGAGYIGSHAAKALHRAGYRVVVFDNLVAGHRAAVKYGEFIQGDICDVAAVRDALRRHEISAVMHFAAFLDVNESVREPARYYRNNVVGALSVLEAMVAEGARAFVFSSTCATYGEPTETPIKETHQQKPINSYGETKLAVERALSHFELAYDLRWVALRYFNAAGADPDGEIGEDHAPEIHLIPRDYIHVSDLADAHVRALKMLVERGASGAYNLGTGRPQSVREVITTVERVSGLTVPWSIGPRRAGDPAVLYAAPARAQVELHWIPQFSDLESIVRTAWTWHRTHPNGYAAATNS